MAAITNAWYTGKGVEPMFKFLKNGGSKTPLPPTTPAPVATGPDSAFRDSLPSLTGVRRELIKTAFRDTLRQQGIPYEWLSLEVVSLAVAPGDETLQIQLMLMRWQETFLRYGPALEHYLLRAIERLDPSTDRSKLQITWRFSPDCGCPFTVMPPPRIWQHAEAPAETAPVQAHDMLDRRRTPRPAPTTDGYQPTQLTRL